MKIRFSEEIALLKRSVGHKEYQLGLLRTELEKVKQEKEGFDFKIAKFDKSAKDLNEMLESQITDKSKKGISNGSVKLVLNDCLRDKRTLRTETTVPLINTSRVLKCRFRIHFDIQTKSPPLLFWIHLRSCGVEMSILDSHDESLKVFLCESKDSTGHCDYLI
ncbi:hypothetical protein Tco_0033530 [Tanacetum coccineum]